MSLEEKISFYLSVLCDPLTKQELKYDDTILSFINEQGDVYRMEDGIPVLFPAKYLQHENVHFAEHYRKDAEVFDYTEEYEDAVTRFEQKRLHEMIVSHIKKEHHLILDIGCGNGWVAQHCLPLGKKVISADIGIINPKKAVERFPSPHHFGLVADACFLPVKDNTVDLIIAAEIMEHIPDPTLFVKELYRCLKPGGVLVITTPYHEKIEYSLCIHCNKPTPRHAHLHSFHEKNVIPLFPEGSKYHMTIFMNKYLLKIHAHIVLKYLPLKVWRFFDRMFQILRPAPLRFLLTINKPD
jgi:SAM-dependent methyltransferase